MPELIHLKCADNYPLVASLYSVKNSAKETTFKPKGMVILASAIGVPDRYYKRFATYIRDQGLHCITFNYRGTGSSMAEDKPHNVRLEDWGKLDTETVIQFAETYLEHNTSPTDERPASKNLPLHFIGHSIGGQLIGLTPASKRLSSLVLIASSSPFWKRWAFPRNLGILVTARLLIPAFSAFRNEFPAQSLGLGSLKFPTSTAKQWAKWMGQPDYLFNTKFSLDTSTYAALDQPLLAYGFKDDKIAPEVNINHLLEHFPNTQITRRFIDPEALDAGPIGHSGFFKDAFKETLWQDTIDWLQGLSPQH